MRSFIILSAAIVCLLSQSSCGILAHQTRKVTNILTAPLRVELDQRHLDGIEEMDRKWVLSSWS